MNILVPGMKPSGFARNLSRFGHAQVMFASFIAGEKSYPGTEALLLPTMPASDGPTSFLPGCAEWQAAQWAANTVWPANHRRRAPSASFRARPSAPDRLCGKTAPFLKTAPHHFCR